MPLPTFALVATIVRERDGTQTGAFSRAYGDRLLLFADRVGVNLHELWVSADLGATWAFFPIPGTATGQNTRGMPNPQGGNLWWSNLALTSSFRTPEANPGAGGFVAESTIGTSGFAYPVAGGTSVVGVDIGAAGLFDRTAPATYALLGVLADGTTAMVPIPTSSDHLNRLDLPGGGTVRLIRVTPVVFAFDSFNTLDGGADQSPPHPAIGAVSASVFYASVNEGTDPAHIWRTATGGSPWVITSPAPAFWADVPAVTALRTGKATAFTRFNGVDLCALTYFDTTNVAQNLRHLRVASFDGVDWEYATEKFTDGNPIVETNVNENGIYYITTYEAGADTTRVYRVNMAAGGFTGSGGPARRRFSDDFRPRPDRRF